MALKTVFVDEDNNEMNCYLNDRGKVYIGVGQIGEEIAFNGYITLDKEDVKKFIKILKDCEKEMED